MTRARPRERMESAITGTLNGNVIFQGLPVHGEGTWTVAEVGA